MLSKNSVNPPTKPANDSSLGAFRAWLMDGNDANSNIEGQPLCAWLLEQGWHEAIDEAWASGSNPNKKDSQGRGWLHWAIAAEAPSWLALNGLRQLDETWWEPDDFGTTPFHLPIFDQRLAHAMTLRWWVEQRSWKALARPFDPMLAPLPQAAGWRAWKELVRP